ncbi:MAG: cell division protein CrgA [Candidatus Nanopelagicales bacterium]
MPESKGRGSAKSRPEPVTKKDVALTSPRWLVPAMLTSFVLGLLWIVVYYIVPDNPVMEPLDNWNVLVGFGLIMVGFGLSTKWR